jgi:hypothetical protein
MVDFLQLVSGWVLNAALMDEPECDVLCFNCVAYSCDSRHRWNTVINRYPSKLKSILTPPRSFYIFQSLCWSEQVIVAVETATDLLWLETQVHRARKLQLFSDLQRTSSYDYWISWSEQICRKCYCLEGIGKQSRPTYVADDISTKKVVTAS